MVRIVILISLLFSCATAATTADVRKMSERADVEGLLKAWDETDREDVRIAVIDAFAQNPSAAEGRELVLRQAQGASSQQVRLAAMRALGAYQGADVVLALVAALSDP